MPTPLPFPLIAGPAGFPPTVFASPGWVEMRVVFGVQEPAAPTQVSRTKTWRTPLFIWPTFTCEFGVLAFGVLDAVTDKNATKRPDELTDGSKLSVALSNPFGSTEINCVCGLHDVAAPWQVSRRKICFPLGESATRFVAAELNAMKRPSALMEGVWLSALPAAPSSAADNTDVCGLQSLAAPSQVSRKKICAVAFCCPFGVPANATKRPSRLTAGDSSATAIAACDAWAAAGQKLAFVEIVKVCGLMLVPPPPFPVGLLGSTDGPVNTVTEAQLSVVSKPLGTVAVNCDAEPNVVARLVAVVVVFQTTIDPFTGLPFVAVFCTKLDPVTVSVTSAALGGAAIAGEIEVKTGTGFAGACCLHPASRSLQGYCRPTARPSSRRTRLQSR